MLNYVQKDSSVDIFKYCLEKFWSNTDPLSLKCKWKVDGIAYMMAQKHTIIVNPLL